MEEENKNNKLRIASETDEGGAETFDYDPSHDRKFVMQLGSPTSNDLKPYERDFAFQAN